MRVPSVPSTTVPADYYVNFLLRITRWVQEHHGPLLRAAERGWCARFEHLEADARRLYARLLQRKGPLFRIEALNYPEVGDRQAALAQLTAAGLLARRPWQPVDELLALLTVPELRALFPEVCSGNRRRAELLTAIAALAPGELRLRLHAALDWCLPLGQLAFERVQLAFFGNQRQSLTEFITTDLGIVRYPDYRIRGRLFAGRRDVDAWLESGRLGQHVVEFGRGGHVEGLGWCRRRLPGWAVGQWACGRGARLDTRIGRWLERCDDMPGALRAYTRADTAEALERRVRVLRRTARPLEASTLALGACHAGVADGVRETLDGLLAPRRRRCTSPWDETMLLQRAPGVRVEQAVQGALQARGLHAIHVENAIMATIFALTFWDVLYADVDGAFVHPYQHAPLDLFEPGFYARRTQQIHARLNQVETNGVLPHMAANWYAHHGRASALVHWGLPWTLLANVASGLPRPALRAILERISVEPLRARRGWPDLTVFVGNKVRFLEVKGPGDQLRPEQRLWLRFLSSVGVEAGVVTVRWLD